jgi:hypothetical protein
MCAVPSAPGAASVRVWHLVSRGRGPRTGPPPPEGVHDTYPLTPQSSEPVGVVREVVGQNLQRDVAAKRRIASAIDVTHPAGADLAGNFVRAEARAGSESQVLFGGLSSRASARADNDHRRSEAFFIKRYVLTDNQFVWR